MDDIELKFNIREFEYNVRELLDKSEGPITAEDVLGISALDLSNFDLYDEDAKLLPYFKNLTNLAVCTCADNLKYIKKLKRIRDLYIVAYVAEFVDFSLLEELSALECLTVSGGDLSGIDFINVEALKKLPKLNDLTLHEFGSADLSFLDDMQQLEHFFCGYANKVTSAESISKLANLSELQLVDFEVDDLDFLKPLNKNIDLELCGMRIKNEIDETILSAFKKADLTENTVGEWVGWNQQD